MMDHNDQPVSDEEYFGPSKSQVKREMHALQELGKQLVLASDQHLKVLNEQLQLDEKLLDAIKLAKRLNSHEARRRQIQYIGKLMRQAPHEALAAGLESLNRDGTLATENLHQIEHERDQLLASDQALTAWLKTHPQVEIQVIRSIIRAARQEQARNDKIRAEGATNVKPQHKHYRALFQAIKAAHAAKPATDDTTFSSE
ncbi:ribosome biogenesis factor YjgA [Orrella sp. 11846]|uniref:ribosome biogenesis factor YjgA n=1 Tax=Orrella sp. 11846 TaxID=3409913 RepID=UPI003B5CC3E0